MYLTYELFKISCYTELFDYEVDISRASEIEKLFIDSRIDKLMKKIKRMSMISFKYFYKHLKRSQIANLFFILLVVNVIGTEKKNRRIMEATKKFLQIELPTIWDCLTGNPKHDPSSDLKIDKKTWDIIVVDFHKSKPLY